MARLIIVSNRLPVSLDAGDDGSYSLRQNVGGLATAIGPYHKSHRDCLWVGWGGIAPEDHTHEELDRMRQAYTERRCVPIFLSREQVSGYYAGFSNDTLWPLFHDFSHEAAFRPEDWQIYQEVNQHFADVLTPLVRKGDTIWIQDYHLMLLPQMLRERFPDASIGWFLHVPFPSPEIFRSLPWSHEILKGVLGADLVGFHTVDYAVSFMASVRLLLEYQCDKDGTVQLPDGHVATVDAFPIGIDYNLYERTSKSNLAKAMRLGIEEVCGKRTGGRYRTSLAAEGDAAAEATAKEGTWWSHYAHEELPELTLARSAAGDKPNKVIVSVDRIDYTKGIPERLRAFDRLLERYPEWAGHVTYYLLATPSRENVETYKLLKEQVDQLVGKINGRYSLLSWTPIHYITRSLPIKPVCGIYAAGDVALVTPLRDGMNLVAKEYLACHDGRDGALVLSNMCGAANELTQAFIVNPYDTDAVCEALHDALEISPEESRKRNIAMQSRLKERTAASWCTGFLSALSQVTNTSLADKRLRMDQRTVLMNQWGKANRRLLLCDYDGTLTPLVRTPDRARPTRALQNLLRRLGAEPDVDLVVVSGRDHETMARWFGDLPVSLIAEHGAWRSDYGLGPGIPASAASGAADETPAPAETSEAETSVFAETSVSAEISGPDKTTVPAETENATPMSAASRTWVRAENMPQASEWQPVIEALMNESVARVPKSFIEHKADALAWHYRLSDQRAAGRERQSLLDRLRAVTGKYGLMTMENAKVVEVCPVVISKGQAVGRWVENGDYDFMLAVGDDNTDETMFAAMPDDAWTIKIGAGLTKARHRMLNPAALQRLFSYLAAESDAVK